MDKCYNKFTGFRVYSTRLNLQMHKHYRIIIESIKPSDNFTIITAISLHRNVMDSTATLTKYYSTLHSAIEPRLRRSAAT